jgi:hypothetical protein
VTAFSGDVSKLRAAGYGLEQRDLIGDVVRAVDRLEDGHQNSASDLARRIGDSGVLRLQGFLWAVKLALPQQPLVEAVDQSFSAFQLMQPAAKAVAH